MSNSTLSFASSSSFRDVLLARNLAPYNVAGVYSPTTNNLAFTTASTERMRIDSAGNVGIGTSSPSGKLNVISGSVAQLIIGFNATSASYLDSDAIVFRNAATTEAGRFTSTGLFQFNSGYGSSATAYGCRAWVNFNGTSAAINASANITSVTRTAAGTFTVAFTNSMPDANYVAIGTVSATQYLRAVQTSTSATGSVVVRTIAENATAVDTSGNVHIAIFR